MATSPARAKHNKRPESRDWITTGMAARRLQVGSINTIKRWAREGKLKHRIVGSRCQISVESVDRLLAEGDPNVQKMQRIERLLAEIEELGADLTPEEWQRLAADRPGRLPWQGR